MTAPISIDSSDRTPIYAQLERGIRVAIATGRLRSGDQLPTVRQLAVDLRVNANTVAKVYVTLEREGVLVTQRGVGTFIADHVPKAAHAGHRERRLHAHIDRFLTDSAALGYSPREAIKELTRRLKEGEN
ncbi:MAG TPA: GntR family transcriptional regulator [Thermoanaerobaculia bacterium]|nr:GntR family transcriptional regulator [Thermoanaerobaculia bacterium]